MSLPLRILLIDDNPDDRMLVLRTLRKEFPGLEAIEVLDNDGLMYALALGRFDLAITDYNLLWSNGLEAMKRIKHRHPECPVIMFTDSGSEEVAVETIKCGLDDYIPKRPGNFPRLAVSVRTLLQSARDRKRVVHLEDRLEDLLSRLQVGVCRSDLEGSLQYANLAFFRIFGLPMDALRRPLSLDKLLPLPGDPAARKEELIRHGQARIPEVMVKAQDANAAWYTVTQNLSVVPDGSCVVETLIEDITERKRLDQALKAKEEEIRQLQKLESIGRLAGGVAHDFNNLLTAINGYSELLLGVVDEANPMRESVVEINKAGTRAARLTRELLAFSRRQMLQPRELDLNALLRKLGPALKQTLGAHLELKLGLDAEPLMVRCDPAQLECVFMHLAANARDAMPESGRLLISSGTCEFRGASGNRDAGERGSELGATDFFAVLTFEDTGAGMDESTLEKIFEPFYTTKAMGKGTGLGLSTVYGIIKQTGGHITVESRVGNGTRFRILLPSLAVAPGKAHSMA
ncbi:MAG: response receiver sensor histidine kinase response regulator [Fibrobacteres bacterium]|nr:response receiver sensor histidine kinase response regulator [Fibrobacterota bacterium]